MPRPSSSPAAHAPAAQQRTPTKRTVEMPQQRSRGQIARRHSITRGTERRSQGAARGAGGTSGSAVDDAGSSSDGLSRLSGAHIASASSSRHGAKGSQKHRHDGSQASRRRGSRSARARNVLPSTEQPWLGGLYFTDVVFIAFTYAINLLRTCGVAELADVIFKGLVYALTSLPIDLYRRWTLSTPPATASYRARHQAAKVRRRRMRGHRRAQLVSPTKPSSSSSETEIADTMLQPDAFASSSSKATGDVVEQLSPFHHLVILLSRFACGHFPHLLPRILFAEETIGPFVYWRTGGGSNAMVQEFTNLSERSTPLIQDDLRGPVRTPSSVAPSFRAYLLSKDARMPIEVQRANLSSQHATTLLYLHGGGFSLGSVAFYAEALLRVRAKIALLEAEAAQAQGQAGFSSLAEARCVAVEYDLSPSARFPIPLLQCLRCYAHLIEVEHIQPESICLAGDSAGGNLAMAMLLCLSGQMKGDTAVPELHERDWSQLPLPGKALLISPWVDLRPTIAHAFAPLRGRQGEISRSDHHRAAWREETGAEGHHDDAAAEAAERSWTEAVAQYDWDFVASEALLHFAQVYAGVLPVPRRVYGPLGWIAHICGVLALGDSPSSSDGEESAGSALASSPWKSQLMGLMDPTKALSALSRPSRRLARATHGFLSDPLLSHILNTSFFGDSKGVVKDHDSPSFGLEPLFDADDRETQLVSDKSHLFEPIDSPFAATRAEKIGAQDATLSARQRGLQLLESHPLLNPAIGDWSKINLKYGCLVTWGERERMAPDIEAWVENVPENTQYIAVPNRADTPAQDVDDIGRTSSDAQKRKESGKGNKTAANAEWIYTAVEKGPGGVHAWPFVSMYLAGSERERERGLDLLADFIARLPGDATSEHDCAQSESGAYTLGKRQELDVDSAANDKADTPDNDYAGSVGSMPSDVDLHGMIDDEDMGEGPQHIYWTGMSSPTIDIADAVRRAQESGDGAPTFTSSGAEQHATPGPSTPPSRLTAANVGTLPDGRQATRQAQPAAEQMSKRPKTATSSSASSSDEATPRRRDNLPRSLRPWPSPPMKETPKIKERGRSRSPRRATALSSPLPIESAHHLQQLQGVDFRPQLSRSGSDLSSSGSSSTSYALRPTSASSPTVPDSGKDTDASTGDQQSKSQAETALESGSASQFSSLSQGGSFGFKSSTAATGKSEVPDTFSVLKQDDDDEETLSMPRVPRFGLDDIAEASSDEAMSPERREEIQQARSPTTANVGSERTKQRSQSDYPQVSSAYTESDDDSGERARESSDEEYEEDDASLSQGLTRYAIQRPEPEGLSDIAEEGSVLSASVGTDARSRSTSPTGGRYDAYSSTSLLGAASHVMAGHESSAAQDVAQGARGNKQWRFLRDEIPMARSRQHNKSAAKDIATAGDEMRYGFEAEDNQGTSGDEEGESSADIAFSPPAGAQPGPKLRTVTSNSSLRSRQDSQESDNGGTNRSSAQDSPAPLKKPKGDVWW